MANEDWPESRARLLEDIEKFSRSGPPKVVVTQAPEIQEPPAPVSTPVEPLPVRQPAPTTTSPSTPTQNDPPSVGSGMLAILKQQAQAKLRGEEQKETVRAEVLARIGSALGAAFRYLHDLANQLNILKPPYPKAYPLFGVADFKDMSWQEGRADYRMRKVSTEERIYEQITFRYRLAGPEKFCLTREPPALEKVQKALFDNSISYTADETRNERGRTERTTFHFPCEVKAGLMIAGDFETGELRLRIRNIERFGSMEFRMAPEALTPQALDELTCLILGRSSRFTQMFERTG